MVEIRSRLVLSEIRLNIQEPLRQPSLRLRGEQPAAVSLLSLVYYRIGIMKVSYTSNTNHSIHAYTSRHQYWPRRVECPSVYFSFFQKSGRIVLLFFGTEVLACMLAKESQRIVISRRNDKKTSNNDILTWQNRKAAFCPSY